uniref:McrB family protein n=1 Tax=Flavobacterium sp. TaxID=239 RepID=UPI004049C555
MEIKDRFKEYLASKGKSESTITNYLGAFTFINEIAESLGLGMLETWNSNNAADSISQILANQTFVEQNSSSNRMYSASLSNFKSFIEETNNTTTKPITKMGSRQNYIAKVKEIALQVKDKNFEALKSPFESEYNRDKEYSESKYGDYSIEERLSRYPLDNKINSEIQGTLQSVISKIKSSDYLFTEEDIDGLNTFCKKIDFILHQCQYLTNIYHGENRYVKEHSIDLPTLFNEMRTSSSAGDFFSTCSLNQAFQTNKNFKSFLKYLYACVKNCQDKTSYPLFYKFYQNIAYWFYGIEMLSYDAFCELYRSQNYDEPKAIHFNLFLHLLAYNLKLELEKEEMLINEVDKTYVKKNIFNYDNSTLDVALSATNTVENITYENIPPVIPFEDFGWRWASTGIASHLNQPNSLRAVLDAVLINGNGEDNQTQNFKDLLTEICLNKYGMSPEDAERLVKNTNGNPVKNIIENSGNYWTHLGLFSTTGKNALVSDLGVRFLTGVLPQDEFVQSIISNYRLPSEVYRRVDREVWNDIKLEIHPFQIILKAFEELHRSHSDEHQYLAELDLKDIIVPFSVSYSDSKIEELVFHILSNRETPSEYSNWPNCYDHYTGDKGERMINEFLFFLECFGFLSSNLEQTRGANKQYYATNKMTKLFGIDGSSIGIQRYNEQTKKNQIFFGAPGTGKSYKVKKRTSAAEKGNRVYRTTFHPDYDHTSFVGGYKPFNSPVLDEDGNAKPYQFQISYKFIPQVFTNAYIEAWNNLDKDYYLIVEEINRGNCAEIFGDIFQLLDREDDGYPIIPTQELLIHLQEKLVGDGRVGISNNEMKLPPNLNILATMNTSDQSLFPMDSAFKRRWDWIYVPIEYNEYYQDSGKENESFKYIIKSKTDDFSFRWIDFIKGINGLISSIPHLGEDKQIGNYFIKGREVAGELVISMDDFIHKVIFFLWNDVFKDEERDENNIFKPGITYQSFFPIDNNTSKIIKEILDAYSIPNSSTITVTDEDIS